MFNAIENAAIMAKVQIDAWFKRMFKEQAGGAEVIATLVIIAIVLALALTFKDKLGDLVKTLWNQMVSDGNVANPTIETWG